MDWSARRLLRVGHYGQRWLNGGKKRKMMCGVMQHREMTAAANGTARNESNLQLEQRRWGIIECADRSREPTVGGHLLANGSGWRWWKEQLSFSAAAMGKWIIDVDLRVCVRNTTRPEMPFVERRFGSVGPGPRLPIGSVGDSSPRIGSVRPRPAYSWRGWQVEKDQKNIVSIVVSDRFVIGPVHRWTPSPSLHFSLASFFSLSIVFLSTVFTFLFIFLLFFFGLQGQ